MLPRGLEFQMSILNYLKRDILLEPSGILLNLIPSHATAATNKEVSNLVPCTHGAERRMPSQNSKKPNKRNVYSPQLRAEMGKAVLEFYFNK